MRGRCLWVLFCVLGFSSIVQGQSVYYEPGFDVGHYTPFSERHKYISDYQQYSFDLRIGLQTNGEKRWQQEYAYPSYGLLVGFTHNTLDSVIYYTHDGNRYGSIGECFSLAGFMNGPIYRGKNWSFDYDIIYGADLWTRYGNEMLGSVLNFHVSFDLGPTVRLTDRLDLAARYLYYHSSNGATFLPDNGVNSHSVRLALRYHPQGRKDFIHDDREPFEKQSNLFISEGIGWLQTYTKLDGQLPDETPFFIGNTLRFGFSRQFNPKFRWDIGLDFLWTGETHYRYELLGEPYNFWKSTHLALSADFEILFGRFAFCAGGAYYLHHGIYIGTDEHKSWEAFTDFEKDHLPEFYTPYYERVGYKLYLGKSRNYFVGTFMKIHLNSIDYIEWTFGTHLL